jgi:hypothetical protein
MPLRETSRVLSVAGWLAALAASTALAVPTWEKRHDWLAFELLGVGLAALPALRAADRRLGGRLTDVLGVVGVAAACWFVYRFWRPVAAFGALTFLVPVVWWQRPGRAGLLLLLIALVCWTAAIVLPSVPLGTLDAVVQRGGPPLQPRFLALAFGASVLVAGVLFGPPRASRWWAVDVLAVALIALASARADYLFDSTAVHHWSAYLGAADVVRHGGWLLWDTPSQYGFLSTLVIAALPFGDLWQGFFVLNVVLLAVSGAVLFVLLRSWGGPGNAVLALVVVLAALLWLPGWRGILVTPSVGPLRFLWCQLLLAVLWAHARRPSRRLLLAGTGLWVVGCLWSAESLVYCSLAWLPAYAWLAWRGEARAWVPVVAFGTAATAITSWYVARLGHPPDPGSFTEYLVGFHRFYTSQVSVDGPVWVLFIVLALCGTAFWFDASPLTLALGATTWGVTSYFVGNCNDVTATNLFAILTTVLAILGDVARRRTGEPWSVVVRLGIGAIVTVLVVMDPLAGRWLNAAALRPESYTLRAGARLPAIDDRLLALLREAGARDGDPVTFLLIEDPGRGPVWTPWLPFASTASLMPLQVARWAEYAERRLALAAPPVGWLVELRDEPAPDPLRDVVARRYRTAQVVEGDAWRITRYERS